MAESGEPEMEGLAAAHRALRDGGDIQFNLGTTPPPEPTPAWVKALGEWLESFGNWLGAILGPVGRFFAWVNSFLPDLPYLRIFFWGFVAILALALLWMAVDRFRHGAWRLPRLSGRRYVPAVEADEEEGWRPAAAPARAWLQEADALAAQGRYAEAVHHLLLRSVADLALRRPDAVRPADTSRDLARAQAIPPAPRRLFGEIAAVVERSLFGGRAVDGDEWARCRAAYADFIQPRSWQGAMTA